MTASISSIPLPVETSAIELKVSSAAVVAAEEVVSGPGEADLSKHASVKMAIEGKSKRSKDGSSGKKGSSSPPHRPASTENDEFYMSVCHSPCEGSVT